MLINVLRLDLATNSTTTPVTPESLESVCPLLRGLYSPAHANACVMCVFRFSRVFSSARSSFTLFLQQRFTPVIILLMIVVLYQTMASLRHCYVKRELTNTLVFLISPRGPYGREEEHALRYYSGGFGQRFLAIPSALGRTWFLGIKCKYN